VGKKREQSGILSLVHLFKKCLLLFLVINNTFAVFDQALFRLSGQVFFLSDMEKKQSAFKSLDCIDSPLLEVYLKASFSEITKTPLLTADKSALSDSINLMPYISLEKLILSSLSSGKDSLNKVEISSLGRKCSRLVWEKLSTEEKSLLISEVFLRDRFKKKGNSDEELGNYKKSIESQEVHEVLKLKPSKYLLKRSLEDRKTNQDESTGN